MGKSDYKKVNDKSSSVQDRLYHKGIYCISDKWIRWSKRYMNRAYRRKAKQSIIQKENNESEIIEK